MTTHDLQPQETNDFHFDIKEKIAILSTNNQGWTKEVNIVSFNGKQPVVDIRKWSPGGRMTKGISLKKEEAKALREVLNNMNLEEV